MDLIIKPTQKCNFCCDFCSSYLITKNRNNVLDINLIYRFLDRYPYTDTIIVNGGDPLMMPPDYYFQILEYIEKNNLPTKLSFTTNLWDYYLHPEKWKGLFSHEKVFVATSFQYGNKRKISKNTVFTEDVFLQIQHKFYNDFGYHPSFISVIDEENSDKCIDLVLLAKTLNTTVKLNPALQSGRQTIFFPLYKMYEIYLKIFQMNLGQYEDNCFQLVQHFKFGTSTCPLLRNCDFHIRTLSPNGRYSSCGSFDDDTILSTNPTEIDFNEEMAGHLQTPLQYNKTLLSLKEDCFSCKNFEVCNSCRKHIHDFKLVGKFTIEEHCKNMKQIMEAIYEYIRNYK